MYSTCSFLCLVAQRKKSLSKLTESQRIRLFFVISEHFLSLVSNGQISGSINKGLLSKAQFSLLRVKVYRRRVVVPSDCLDLPFRVYSGKTWCGFLVKVGIVGFPLRFFILFTFNLDKFAFALMTE